MNKVGPMEICDLQAELSRKEEDELEILFYKLLIRKNGILLLGDGLQKFFARTKDLCYSKSSLNYHRLGRRLYYL